MKRIDPIALSNPIIDFKYRSGYKTGVIHKNYMSSVLGYLRTEYYLHRGLRKLSLYIIKI